MKLLYSYSRMIVITLFCISFSIPSFSQTQTIEAKHNAKINYSQKHGSTKFDGEYTTFIKINSTEFKYKTRENQSYSIFNTIEITDSYVIGKNSENNYLIYKKNSRELYVIDYFMKRYILAAYGSNAQNIQKVTEEMMLSLKLGKSQRQVIEDLK